VAHIGDARLVPRYDLCVIGAGPAGYAAAMRGWDYGLRVALIEKGPLGGAGVHNGALSSKTLWELSRDYRRALRRDRGFVAENVVVDYGQVVHAVESAVSERTHQLERQLEALSKPLPGSTGCVTLIRGTAHFLTPHTIHVEGVEPGDEHTITADNFALATGSRPRELPGIAVDGKYIVTSEQLMRLDRFPRSLVILGAGVIGCEFATIFANFGQTKVYLIDRADRILPFEDDDVAQVCAANLEARGVTIHHQAQLLDMKVVNGSVHYTIKHRHGGVETISVERALISIGRVPNTLSLKLENAGLNVTDRGHLDDVDTRTAVPHIYAVGDVTHDLALVSVGEIEGRHCVERICGDPDPLSYENVSWIMFLDPEVAGVGLNEQKAQEKRIPYRVAVYSYRLVARAIAMRTTDGFIKLLVSDCDDMKILGMRALGAHASTSIETVALMIRQNRSVNDIAELLHPHPSITEGLQDCIRMLLGKSIFKPHVFQGDLRVSTIRYDDEEEAP
jgi:dihydrolipoamide dehydrogenase